MYYWKDYMFCILQANALEMDTYNANIWKTIFLLFLNIGGDR